MDFLEKTKMEKRGILSDGPAKTILFVDDEMFIRQFGEQVILRCGYRVQTACSGEEALDIYGKLKGEIALVILDLSMPGMGGHECMKRIISENPRAKVVITSGYSDERSREAALNLGAVAFLGKPFGISQVIETIHEILEPE